MPTLDCTDKLFVYSHHLSVPFRELVVDANKSLVTKGQEPSLDDNLVIHGDNSRYWYGRHPLRGAA